MAFLTVNLMSTCLMRTVPVNVILPVDKVDCPGMLKREDKPFKTLYLLHGLLGSYVDWVNGTRIQRYADEYDLAVVMPSGDNAFYIDEPLSHNYYGEFIGRELVELTRKLFHLSHKREDTFIGGLSMGGYGAIRNGLKYHDTFGAIISLSGALVVDEMQKRTNETSSFVERKDFTERIFGDLEEVMVSDKNPKYLVEQMIREKVDFPQIYLACGDQDDLLPANKDFYKFLQDKGVEAVFEIGEGNHEWDFWDTYIKKAIEWLPTEKTGLGMNSGNVAIS